MLNNNKHIEHPSHHPTQVTIYRFHFPIIFVGLLQLMGSLDICKTSWDGRKAMPNIKTTFLLFQKTVVISCQTSKPKFRVLILYHFVFKNVSIDTFTFLQPGKHRRLDSVGQQKPRISPWNLKTCQLSCQYWPKPWLPLLADLIIPEQEKQEKTQNWSAGSK